MNGKKDRDLKRGLKVRLRDLSQESLKIQQSVSFENLELEEGVELSGDVEVDLDISLVQDILLVRGGFSVEYSFECYRCLEQTVKSVQRDVFFDFEIERNREFADLTEGFRQAFIMESPTRLLCDENCQGLCPTCGGNLNQTQCQHEN